MPFKARCRSKLSLTAGSEIRRIGVGRIMTPYGLDTGSQHELAAEDKMVTDGNVSLRRTHPSLSERLGLLASYTVGLYVVGGLITGQWRPTGGGEWLWWVSAIALYVFSTLSAPFFVRPRDSLANTITSALLLFTVDLSAVQNLRPVLEGFRWGMFAVAVVTGILATSAVALHGAPLSDLSWRAKLGRLSYQLAVAVGNRAVMFTGPALVSIIGFHQTELAELLWLAMLWVFIVTVRPGELLYAIWGILRRIKDLSVSTRCVGRVTRVDDPNLVRVSLQSASTWRPDRLHSACLPGNRHVAVIPLFVQTQDEELFGTGLCCDAAANASIAVGEVWTAADDETPEALVQQLAGRSEPTDLVGFLVEESNIAAIRFEIAGDRVLEEGTVVFARDREKTIYYQILDAVTKEEVFTRNPRGTLVVLAGQLGTLEDGHRFEKHGWVPPMNAPVFLPKGETPPTRVTTTSDEFVLGNVAQSGMPVLASLSDMLEYHTAILGVTGTGKTELVFDIIRAHLTAGRKVFCVDFTGEYNPRLADCNPEPLGFDDKHSRELEELVNAIEYGQYKSEKEKRALDTWMTQARPKVEQRIAEFVGSDGASVGIFELEDIVNTRATLRATELYLSAIFAWARENRRAREIVVVLEEAHTVIPEMVMFGFDKGETQAVVARMAQIALQGRKYGIGLLLVSQRTALVSKTLLSQCNTTISFAMYDKTGLDYLASVFASEHVRAIPNLRFLQGIAFGKAIMSDRPVIFEIPQDAKKREASKALNITLTSTQQKTEIGEPEPPASAGDPTAASKNDGIPF